MYSTSESKRSRVDAWSKIKAKLYSWSRVKANIKQINTLTEDEDRSTIYRSLIAVNTIAFLCVFNL